MARKTLKDLFKKGNQLQKLLLGFIEINKDLALDTITKIKQFAQSVGLFILGTLAHLPIIIQKAFFYLCKSGKNLWGNIKLTFYQTLGVLVALFCVSLVLYFVFSLIKHINPAFITSLSSQYILIPDNNDIESIKTVQELIVQGKIINASEIYSHMLEYYNTLITILIALIGVFGLISWFTIQGKASYEVKKTIDEHLESEKFDEKLSVLINTQFSKDETLNQAIDANMGKIVSCILCSDNFKKIIKEEIADNSSSKNNEILNLKGVEDGDEIQ